MNGISIEEFKAMFHVGDTWRAVNTYITATNGDRKILEIRDSGIISETSQCKNIHTVWPKASQIISARPGYVKFRLSERFKYLDGHTVELTKVEGSASCPDGT